jgi:glutamyl-tRNA reductase
LPLKEVEARFFGEGQLVDSALLVIGLNHRTAPLAMRERFWISETRRYAVLQQLSRAEGVDEVIVLTTSSRTEFLIWASEPMLAANSVLNFLSVEHGLKLSEWEHFYRLIAEDALAHIFRVTCGLDSPLLGEPDINSQLKTAWEQSRAAVGMQHVLDAVVERALSLSGGLRKTITVGASGGTISTAAVDRARDRNAASVAAAEKIVLAEAQAFSSKLRAEGVVSTIVALHQRLDEIRRQDLESFIKERGPFTREQDQALHAITAQLVQKIASFLARELKDLPEQRERERMTAAVQRLFHLKTAKAALAGTRSETSQHEQHSDSEQAIAINS